MKHFYRMSSARRAPRKPRQEDKQVMKDVGAIRRNQVALFFSQDLAVAGDMFFKGSRFLKSRKYHAELRGVTIAVFRTPQIARDDDVEVTDVVAVILVPQYNVDVIQKDENTTRIYITSGIEKDDTLMYIKVTSCRRVLEAWRRGLARAKNAPLPSLSDLTIESVIGRGGGGKVFLVQWNKDNKVYALKVIEKIQAYRSAKSLRHVVTERYLMEKLNSHPFLLPIHFAFQTERNLFIGTPFCPGGDLASYLRSKGDLSVQKFNTVEWHEAKEQRKKRVYGRLSEDQTRHIAAEIILGLEHLHEQGIVYRDLKPENIFIDGTGHIKIGDYGLAKQLTGDANELRSGSVCGTRNYLPPEMLFGKMYSLQADIWSLGVMMYRMMCGMFPFDAPRSKDLFVKVRDSDLQVPSWLSKYSTEILKAMLQKDPHDRPTLQSLKEAPFFRSVDWASVFALRSGESIPDVDTGNNAVEALENFELSKLQGITVGDYIGQYGDLEHEVPVVPTHLQDTRRMMVGFEFGMTEESAPEPPLLEVRQSGGTFWKLASVDVDFFGRSPRGIMQREQLSGQEADVRSPRHSPRS